MGTEELEDHEDGGGECSAHCGAEEDERDEETSHHCIGRGIGGEAGADPNEHCWAEAVVNQRENVGAFDGEIIAIGACHCSTCKNCSCCIGWHPYLCRFKRFEYNRKTAPSHQKSTWQKRDLACHSILNGRFDVVP